MNELMRVKDIYTQESLVSAMAFVWTAPKDEIGNIAKEGMGKNFEKGREKSLSPWNFFTREGGKQ